MISVNSIKQSFFSALVLITSIGPSYAIDLATCRLEIENYGKTPLTEECKTQLIQQASKNNSRKDDYEVGEVFAIEGALFYKNNKIDVFAGEYAAVTEPVAVVSDSKKGEIAFLNKSGDIMIYSTRFFGNISPGRKISNKALYGATDLCLGQNNILALLPKDQKIVMFDRSGNSNGGKGRKRDQLISEYLYGDYQFVSMGCSADADKIYLLDTGSNLYVFEPAKKSLRKIKSQTGWDSLSVPKTSN